MTIDPPDAPAPVAEGAALPPGLTDAEAAARAAQGRANVDTTRQVTDRDVIRRNTATFFNVILAVLIAALLVVGEIRDGLFVGVVVAANVAVATAQELIANRRLQALRALTAPRALVVRGGVEREVPAEEVVQGDLVHLTSGGQVVADGPIVAHTAEVDESLLTGESEGVRRGPGAMLRSGSYAVSGECYYTAEHVGAAAYVMRLTADARELIRKASPLTFRFNRLLRVLLIATSALATVLFIQLNIQHEGLAASLRATTATVTTVVPVGLLLGMTVVSAVGALRVSRAGAIVQDIYAVEALNYVDVIGLDKTGTLTTNRLALDAVHWLPGVEWAVPWLAAFARDKGDENRSAAALATALGAGAPAAVRREGDVAFTSRRRWSAAALVSGAGERRVLVLGAPETVLAAARGEHADAGAVAALRGHVDAATARGLRALALAAADALPDADAPLPPLEPLAVITLSDELRQEVRSAFAIMDELEIAPKVISGDSPDTVAALLAQLDIPVRGGAISGAELEPMDDAALGAAVDAHTVFGRVSPALKARIVDAMKARGHFVAMVGDGANDVHALRAADVAVAMASGTSIARSVAGIVLLEDSFGALVRGTREATFVLGNAARLSKLFIAKSVYAYLLILVTNLLGLDFPFLPRQGSVSSLLTLGIPAVVISVGVPPHNAGRDFTRSVLRFALPAGLALAAAAVLVQFATEGLFGRDIEAVRTLITMTIVAAGLVFVIEVLGIEGANWRRPIRPVLTTAMAAVLFWGLLLTLGAQDVRSFFAFTEVSAGDWAIVGVATAATLAAQFAISRYWPQILDFVTAKPPPHEAPRGRAVDR